MNVRAMSLLCVLAGASVPCAQDAGDPLALVPADATVVAWADGPGSLRAAFADTRLARMLGSRELVDLLPMSPDDLRAGLEQAAGELGVDAVALEDLAVGYRGRIAFALGLDVEALAEHVGSDDLRPERLDPWVLVVLSEDRERSFDPLLELFDHVADEAEGEVVDLRLGEHDLRVIEGDRMSVALPFVHDGKLVLCAATDLEGTLDRILYGQRTAFSDEHPGRLEAPLGARVELGWIGPLLDAALAEANVEVTVEHRPVEAARIMGIVVDALGLRSLQSMALFGAPAGEHVALDATVRLAEEGRGLLGAFLTVPDDLSAALDVVPVQRPVWSLTPLDFERARDAVYEIVDGLEPVTGMSVADMESQVEDTLRVQLADLIDPLGDVVLGVDAREPEQLAEEDPTAGFDGLCYGVTLDDAGRFGEALEGALRSRGLHAARKTEDYRGFEVHRLPLLGLIEISYAVTDRLFLVGLGSRGATGLRSVLDEARDRNEGIPRPEMPEPVRERLAHAFADWHGISVAELGGILRAGRAGALAEIPDQRLVETITEVTEAVARMARRHDLETLVSVTRSGPAALRMQIVW